MQSKYRSNIFAFKKRVVERNKKTSAAVAGEICDYLFLGKIEKTVEDRIRDYCEKNKIERIDLNSVTSLKWFDITPFEFLYFIKNAEFIFTDSFHASVFSIIFGKCFFDSRKDRKQ